MTLHNIGEVMREYEMWVTPLDFPIKGRIVKYETERGTEYSWSISHHYSPSAGAGVYFPSKTTTRSYEETEMLFKAYAGAFSPDFSVIRNDGY